MLAAACALKKLIEAVHKPACMHVLLVAAGQALIATVAARAASIMKEEAYKLASSQKVEDGTQI